MQKGKAAGVSGIDCGCNAAPKAVLWRRTVSRCRFGARDPQGGRATRAVGCRKFAGLADVHTGMQLVGVSSLPTFYSKLAIRPPTGCSSCVGKRVKPKMVSGSALGWSPDPVTTTEGAPVAPICTVLSKGAESGARFLPCRPIPTNFAARLQASARFDTPFSASSRQLMLHVRLRSSRPQWGWKDQG